MSDIGSPPPLVYLSETEREDSPEVLSPLYHSLVEAIKHPSCVNRAWISTVADMEKNNPRALHVRPYNDGSLHFVDKGGNLLCMAFPAVLVLDGKYGRTGPYFSLATGEQGVKKANLASLSKTKAVFELKPLSAKSWDEIPLEAAEVSSMAMNTLQTFYSMVENKRNTNVDVSKQPATTPFHRTDIDRDCFQFVVSTASLFRNLPDPGKTPIKAMTLEELMSSKASVLPRPTKMQLAVDNSNLVEEVDGQGQVQTRPQVRTIADMPDPEGIYSAALGAADVSNSSINVPNVRDGNGALIMPHEYEQKLETGSIVMVNVYLKLWTLRPSNKNGGNYRPKDGEENGTRIYQLMLNSMQVLPVADISQIALLDNRIGDVGSKGKRKAADETGAGSQTKKKVKDDIRANKVATRRSARAGPSTKEDVTMENA